MKNSKTHLKITVLGCVLATLFCINSLHAQQKDDSARWEELSRYIQDQKIQRSEARTKTSLKYGAKGVQTTASPSNPRPKGVNPFVSLYSKNKGSYRAWREYNKKRIEAQASSSAQRTKARARMVPESETPGTDSNGSIDTAEVLPELETNGDVRSLTITGNLLIDEPVNITDITAITTEEDNSSIPLATPVEFDSVFQGRGISTVLGEITEPGDTTFVDTDFYKIELNEKELLNVSTFVDRDLPNLDDFPLDLVVLVFNSAGEFIAFQDFFLVPTVSFLAPESDTYYFGVYDFKGLPNNPADLDPFVSNGGVEPIDSRIVPVKDYIIAFEYIGPTEEDFYSLPLKKGDVFSIVTDTILSATVKVVLPNKTDFAATPFYFLASEEESPIGLPGTAGLEYIAPEDGTYFISIGDNVGPYVTNIRVARPGNEINKGRKQIIYLDYTGDTKFSQQEFFNIPDSIASPEDKQLRTLSPFRNFLERWGVENNLYNTLKLTYQTTQVVRESVRRDFLDKEINPNFDVQIISDYGIPYLGKRIPKLLKRLGIPYSRILVGGSIEESGIETIGIASAIDVGNYSLSDDALTLLDVLSSSEPEDASVSLLPIPLAEGKTIADVIPVGVGNVTAHEIGHYIGNFHTSDDGAENVFSIMDEGGAIINEFGLREGEKFGEDDEDVDFVTDQYSLNEGMVANSTNKTGVNTAFAFSFIPFGYKGENPISVLDAELASIDTNVELQLRNLENQDIIDDAFAVYPNPVQSQGLSQVQFATSQGGNVTVELYDLQGRKISTVYNSELKPDQLQKVSISPSRFNLSNGTYIVMLNLPEGTFSQKISIY